MKKISGFDLAIIVVLAAWGFTGRWEPALALFILFFLGILKQKE